MYSLVGYMLVVSLMCMLVDMAIFLTVIMYVECTMPLCSFYCFWFKSMEKYLHVLFLLVRLAHLKIRLVLLLVYMPIKFPHMMILFFIVYVLLKHMTILPILVHKFV